MKGDRSLAASQPCPNCGDPTPGNYCPGCGQRRTHRRISLRRLLADAVEDQFSLNAALPRTLKTLLFRPGLLTIEYLRGRIASYIPPFRLYLITSFLFFLNIALFGCDDDDDSTNVGIFTTADSAAVATDSAAAQRGLIIGVRGGGDSTAPRPQRQPQDSAIRARQQEQIAAEVDTFFMETNFPFEPVLHRRVKERALAIHALQGEELNRTFVRELQARFPLALFLMIPVFTAIIKLLYVRHPRYYVEHFVYALHAHSFAFLNFTFTVWLQRWGWITAIFVMWVVVYMLFSMRRVYGQSWWVTIPKFVILGVAHLLLTGIAVLGIIAFMFFFAPL